MPVATVYLVAIWVVSMPVATVYLVAIWVVSIYKVVIDFPIAH